MKILVLHPGALGDIILSLPALGALRYQFHNAAITLAGNLDFLVVVSGGYADRVISLASLPLHRLYAPDPLPREDALFWNSYDRIISWTGAGQPEFTRKLTGANPGAQTASWIPAAGDDRHVSQIFMDSLKPLLSFSGAVVPTRITLSEEARHGGEVWLRACGWMPGERGVVLHPGAGSLIKRWPIERFQALAREIVQNITRNLLIVEGPAESGIAREIGRDLRRARVAVAESLRLDLVAGALALCCAFAGNDSGIAHLAAGLDVPCVVLFGPTRPENWAPLGKHVAILRDVRGCLACDGRAQSAHTCLENISVAACLSALQSHLQAVKQMNDE